MLHSDKVKYGTGRAERLEEHAVETDKQEAELSRQFKSLFFIGAVLILSNLFLLGFFIGRLILNL